MGIIIRFIMSRLGFPRVPTMEVTQRVLKVFERSVKNGPPCKLSPLQYHHELTESVGGVNTFRLPELGACKVTKLELYKSTNDVQHEFVLAYIEHWSQYGTQSRVFLLERDSIPTTVSQTPKFDEPNLDLEPEVDTITIYEYPSEALAGFQGDLCYEVTFPFSKSQPYVLDPRPDVLDLASAAAALSTIAPSCNLTSHMSFWFANNLCRLLAHGRKHEVQEKYRGKKCPRAGHIGSMPVLEQSGKLIVQDPPSSSDVAEDLRTRPDIFTLPSGYLPEIVDPDSSGLTAHPKGEFVSSDVVDGYYKTFRQLLIQARIKIKSSEDDRDGYMDPRIIESYTHADQLGKENRQMKEEIKRMKEDIRQKDEENRDLHRRLEEALQASTLAQG